MFAFVCRCSFFDCGSCIMSVSLKRHLIPLTRSTVEVILGPKRSRTRHKLLSLGPCTHHFHVRTLCKRMGLLNTLGIMKMFSMKLFCNYSKHFKAQFPAVIFFLFQYLGIFVFPCYCRVLPNLFSKILEAHYTAFH